MAHQHVIRVRRDLTERSAGSRSKHITGSNAHGRAGAITESGRGRTRAIGSVLRKAAQMSPPPVKLDPGLKKHTS